MSTDEFLRVKRNPNATFLFYSGSAYRDSPREWAFLNADKEPGFSVNHGGFDNHAATRKSLFCLVPSGKWGGYGNRDAYALPGGCRPAYIQDHLSKPFEELIPISLYGGISVPEGEARISNIIQFLR